MSPDFSKFFDTFSARQNPQEGRGTTITNEFRNRVLMLCSELFYAPIFWEEVHRDLQYLRGRPALSAASFRGKNEDALQFLTECSEEHFLDFVERVFRLKCYRESHFPDTYFVDTINEFLRHDNLPYTLTNFVSERIGGNRHSNQIAGTHVTAFPRIIRRDSDLLHETAIAPTLTLLSHPALSLANEEFLDALKDYRNGDYGDCVTKCGSSFESVMKVICDRKGWSYQQSDTAVPLLDTIFSHIELEGFFKQPITLVSTIRNRLSTSHGAGTQPREVSMQVAQYSINAAAAAILLLVEETKP